MSGTLSWKVTTLQSLVVIGIMVVDVFSLSHDLVRPRDQSRSRSVTKLPNLVVSRDVFSLSHNLARPPD